MIEDLFGDYDVNGYAFSPSNEPFLSSRPSRVRFASQVQALVSQAVSPMVVEKLDETQNSFTAIDIKNYF